jgi:photosystem II stability/assembly factor-like uncharacterized protein
MKPAEASKKRVVPHLRRLRSRSWIPALVAVLAVTAVGGTALAVTSTPGSKSQALVATPTTVPGSPTSTAPDFSIPGGSTPGSGAFNAVTCINTSACIAVGADAGGNGTASLTVDGGQSWTDATVPSGTPKLDAIACGDSTRCVAVGRGGALSTTDGGSTWALDQIPSADTTLLGVACPTALVCVAVGIAPNPTEAFKGLVALTADGGLTWSTPTLPAVTPALGGVACLTASTCAAVGAGILTTADAGNSWHLQPFNGGPGAFQSISCPTSQRCVALGPNPGGIADPSAPADAALTTDGGSKWNLLPMPSGSSTLEQIACSSASLCLVGGATNVGEAPFVVSGDGGSTWKATVTPAHMTAISGISCPGPTTCVVVGRAAANPITASTTDGVTWSATPQPVSSGLEGPVQP